MPDFLFPPGANYQLFSATITAMQKFVFLLYIGAYFYNGLIFNLVNDFLTPITPEKETKSWFSYFNSKDNPNECKDFLEIFNRHRCINHLFIVDNAEVLRVISGMTPFAKWRYLMIVMTSKSLTPYLIQFSMLLKLFMVASFICSQVLKLLDAFEINPILDNTRLSAIKQTMCSKISSVIGTRYTRCVAITLGILAVSHLVCFLTSNGSGGSSVCESTSCLYCISRLSNTIFRELEKTENDILTDPKFILVFPLLKFTSLCILTVLIWFFSILIVCIVIYFTIDAFYNVRDTGYVMMENFPGTSPNAFQSAWNYYIPKFRASVFRFVQLDQMNDVNQPVQSNEP